jgi:hypothetical protein
MPEITRSAPEFQRVLRRLHSLDRVLDPPAWQSASQIDITQPPHVTKLLALETDVHPIFIDQCVQLFKQVSPRQMSGQALKPVVIAHLPVSRLQETRIAF